MNKQIKHAYLMLYKYARAKDTDKCLSILKALSMTLGHGSVDDYLSSLYITDRTLFNLLVEAL